MRNYLTFQQLLSTLTTRLHSSVVKNLSVPITFVCLLHLANDKVRVILGTEYEYVFVDFVAVLPRAGSAVVT